nr:unnamed protein product [Digitaria exilis]
MERKGRICGPAWLRQPERAGPPIGRFALVVSMVTISNSDVNVFLNGYHGGTSRTKLAYFYGYYVVERFVGHGIGTAYDSEPLILHHANENSGRMVEGQIFTIEPILTMEKTEFVTWEDGWTTVTADGSWAAQFEHTILVTRNGAEILTKP